MNLEKILLEKMRVLGEESPCALFVNDVPIRYKNKLIITDTTYKWSDNVVKIILKNGKIEVVTEGTMGSDTFLEEVFSFIRSSRTSFGGVEFSEDPNLQQYYSVLDVPTKIINVVSPTWKLLQLLTVSLKDNNIDSISLSVSDQLALDIKRNISSILGDFRRHAVLNFQVTHAYMCNKVRRSKFTQNSLLSVKDSGIGFCILFIDFKPIYNPFLEDVFLRRSLDYSFMQVEDENVHSLSDDRVGLTVYYITPSDFLEGLGCKVPFGLKDINLIQLLISRLYPDVNDDVNIPTNQVCWVKDGKIFTGDKPNSEDASAVPLRTIWCLMNKQTLSRGLSSTTQRLSDLLYENLGGIHE